LSKNRVFFGGRKFATTYTGRDRENFEKMDFGDPTTNGFDWSLTTVRAVLPEAATRKQIVSMRKHTGKTVSEQEAA
jgi:hypothetical protein